MKLTGDWLHRFAGMSALGFGIYCMIIGVGVIAYDLADFSLLLILLCFIYGFIYIIYGIFALGAKPGGMSSFMAVGFFIGTYWWSPDLQWFLWPLVIMPFVILALTVLIVVRFILKARDENWRNG